MKEKAKGVLGNTELVNKVYEDAFQPSVRQVGYAGESLLKFVALPFAFLGMTAEQLKEKYRVFIEKAVNKVPPEKRVNPKAAIVCPLLEHAKYLFSDEASENLIEMFAGLLANAINCDTKENVHVSYVHTLQQIGAIEAKILLQLYEMEDVRVLGFSFKRGTKEQKGCIQVLSDEPEVLVYENENVFFYYDLIIVDDDLEIADKNFYESISILEHHNLISSFKVNKFKNEEKYTLEKHDEHNIDVLDPNFAIKGYTLTKYGRDFIGVCIDPIVNVHSFFDCEKCGRVFQNADKNGICTRCGSKDTKLL